MREIEVKLRVKDLDELEQKLQERGTPLSEPIAQDDMNYALKGSTNEFERAQEGDIIIRIRREPNRAQYESNITDPDAIHNILALLGWYPAIRVKKVRRKGKLGDYEICLDRVEELGDFVELEKLAVDDADPEKIREELFSVLENLGLSRNDEEIHGYDTQLYFLHKNND